MRADLDRYLDGLLVEGERATFERALEHDALLAGEIACQRRIDASLGRLFQAPPFDRLAAAIASAAMTPPPGVRKPAPFLRARTLAAAALIALFVVGLAQVWIELHPPPAVDPYAPQPWRSFAQIYDDEINSGFKPSWVCKSDREFETAFRRRLGQALAVIPPPPGIAWAGVDYCNSISPATVTVLAHVLGKEVIVFADRALLDKGVALPAGSPLSLFKRQVDGLVLYECTPHAQAQLLDLFYAPGLAGPSGP